MTNVYILLLILLLAYMINWYLQFRRNVLIAKQSGIKTIPVPLDYLGFRWLTFGGILIRPIEALIPDSLKPAGLRLLRRSWWWHDLYEPFAEFGADTFINPSGGRTNLFTCSPDVINEMCNRWEDFPKPVELYAIMNMFGINVLTTEGTVWKHHRRIASKAFTEKNNVLVWEESLRQSQAMLKDWTEKEGGRGTVRSVQEDTMKLTLLIISYAGFGVHMDWSGLEEHDKEIDTSEGYTMSYEDALITLLHNVLWVLVLPKWLSRILPIKGCQRGYKALYNWNKYLRRLLKQRKEEILAGSTRERVDIMGALVSGAGITKETLEKSAFLSNSPPGPSMPTNQLLSDDEILGNAWTFIIAGHETSANTLCFAILELARNPGSQKRLQNDLDAVFNDRPIIQWSYQRDYFKLQGTMAEAVMNETLRLYPPATAIPKSTPKGKPQAIMVDGKRCVIPENTMIQVAAVDAHRHTRYWPRYDADDENDLNRFKPERWLISEARRRKQNVDSQVGSDETTNVSTGLYQPPKGAFLPFSQGRRSCIGQRFAQVETLAVLAAIFHEYSVELAVDEWAGDQEIEMMDQAERRSVWERANERADWLMTKGTGIFITLQLQNGDVPVRLVKRGSEHFHRD